jgi:peptidoglycan/LPS O-acetylase OafA/YrhL
MAVDLFFCLSGFVFYWLYSKPIAGRQVSGYKFSVYRFSRLYPLHLATFVLVAVGQAWLLQTQGCSFVYSHHDLKHFLLNLAFIPSWGAEDGYSFNAPSWSVSVEMLLYALFFLCCRWLPIRLPLLAGISLGGFYLTNEYAPLGRGIGYFFLGGCVFILYEMITSSRRRDQMVRWVFFLTAGVWLLTILNIYSGDELITRFLHSSSLMSTLNASFEETFTNHYYLWPGILLFPMTILSLALLESRRGPIGKRFSFLGDISYASYLWHFPLQLMFSIFTIQLGINQSYFYSPLTMLAFFVTLILLSLVSHRIFELPVQKALRRYA